MPRNKSKKDYVDEEDIEEGEEEKKTNGGSTARAKMIPVVHSLEDHVSTDESDDLAGKPDGLGGLKTTSTFEIGYATTSRSTCKRCDLRIPQGQLRVSSRPLFRGKPGYTIYKHLECTVFTSDVLCAEDVNGYDDLDIKDYQQLATRILESEAEIQLETQELEPEELVQKDFRGTIRDSPPGLNATLLPFQKEGVSWMYCQEVGKSGQEEDTNVVSGKNKCAGGILADEMGMGKTLQTISLILDHRPLLQHMLPGAKHPPNSSLDHKMSVETEEKLWEDAFKDWNHEMDMSNISPSLFQSLNTNKKASTSKGDKKKKNVVAVGHDTDEGIMNRAGARAGTLVICPVAALTQWKTEIEKFCEPGTVQVVIYHGPDRERLIPRQMLRKYDVVLTTYQVLEADFRKMISPNRVKCPNCGGKFKIDKLRIHLKYFCGEAAERTEAQARQQRSRDRATPARATEPSTSNKNAKGKKDSAKVDEEKAPLAKSQAMVKVMDPKASLKRMKGELKSTQSQVKEKNQVMDQKASKKRKDDAKGNDESKDTKKRKINENNDSAGRDPSSQRSQRRAAAVANTRLKVLSSKTADDGESSDDASDFDGDSLSENGSVPEEDADAFSDESDSISDDENLKRARAAQEKALQTVKNSGKKTFPPANKGKKNDKDNKEETKSKLERARDRRMSRASDIMKSGKSSRTSILRGMAYMPDEAFLSESDDDNSEDSVDMEGLLQEAMAGAKMSALHSVCWWRIVLDEAHMIKSRSSQTAAAAFSLIGISRWCLSGTPLQNRVGEFYSLVRFLRLDPLAHYLCRHKNCPCKSIHYRMFQGKCKGCGHGSVEHYSHFNKHILNPIQRDGYSGDGRKAMFTLKTEILDPYVMRRTKTTKAEDMQLPPRLVEIRPVRLHPIEEDFYNALYTQTKSSFDDYVREGTLLNNYAHIFDLLIRMRQSVAHPYLVLFSKGDRKKIISGNATATITAQDCGICHEPTTNRVRSTCCQAVFCRACVDEYMETEINSNVAQCPSCREPFSIDLIQGADDVLDDCTLKVSGGATQLMDIPSVRELVHVSTGSILHRIDLAQFSSSTKIEALAKELVQMRQSSPGSKAIVFSQFVNMLDLIRWRLHSDPFLSEVGLGIRCLHGGMDVKARDSTLKDFREDPQCRVLLMSLKAGGVALNLTVADHIFLMDPWWNPAAENQAIDRTHRLGQYRPIKAIRFIAEDTVEERILQLQEKKRLVFDGTVGRDAASLKMLSIEDMKCLFQ